MSYTVLRVVKEGVVQFDAHERRFTPAGAAAVRAYRAFAEGAASGIYALTWRGDALSVEARAAPSLSDGIPVRYMVSPLAGGAGRIAKTPPPNLYYPARLRGVATLLTSADGSEILESDTAAAVSWDGARFVLPPRDRPRLESTTATALQAGGAVSHAPLRREALEPLGLVNAVSGLVAPNVPGRLPFPPAARSLVAEILRASTRRA